jgi:uncharacterized DUF497 family protein
VRVDYVYKNRFIWNIDKAKMNPGNHDGITFESAADSFDDPLYIEELDEENSVYEERYNRTVFVEGSYRTITVSHTLRDGLIRIFSARKANRRETKAYERNVEAYLGA